MADSTSIPLIPRKTLFENAHALNPRLSPDGRWLAWIAAVDGVMNVWAAPRDDLSKARPLTRQTERPIFEHLFARTNAHVLFRKDRDGDENFHLWCVGIDGSNARDLTPYPNVLADLYDLHHKDPHLIAVGMNDRDPRWHDQLLFFEYFNGDTGKGLGASHQTGWTGLVADLIIRRHTNTMI